MISWHIFIWCISIALFQDFVTFGMIFLSYLFTRIGSCKQLTGRGELDFEEIAHIAHKTYFHSVPARVYSFSARKTRSNGIHSEHKRREVKTSKEIRIINYCTYSRFPITDSGFLIFDSQSNYNTFVLYRASPQQLVTMYFEYNGNEYGCYVYR